MPGILAVLVGAGIAFTAASSTAPPSEESPSEIRLDPDYVAARQAIEDKNWSAALESLWKAVVRNGESADLQNLLGHAYRNSGQLDRAFEHYRNALRLDPAHRGAHEYIGEAYLMIDQPDRAEEHLAALARICAQPCEEYDG